MVLAGLLVLAASASSAEESATRLSFREATSEWGLDFRHHHGGSGERYMVETMGGAVVAFDYDGDGDADLLFVDGGPLPGYEGEAPRSRLFRNDGAQLVDVTDRSGIQVDGYGAGATAGDVDGDGDLDLYVTLFGKNQLFLNRGDGTFEERAEDAGVDDPLWGMSAAFFDPDRDGDLDLYVTNYVDFTIETHQFCGDASKGLQVYCNPDAYRPQPDRFFLNRGDGTFEEAAQAVGLTRSPGAGLGVVAGDLDRDGWVDLYVANDLTPNFLFRNRGDGTFEDLSLISGSAYSDQGFPEAGMGVDLGDYDGDGKPDLVVTNFEFQTNAFYKNLGSNLFLDARYIAGIAEPSIRMLGFGVLFGDFDHDTDLDLVVANGHINDNASEAKADSRYPQPHQLFENGGSGRYRLVPEAGGLSRIEVSRALAAADLDRDGDQELVVANNNGPAELYENLAASGNWLQVALSGDGETPHGVGAAFVAETEAGRQLRQLLTARSYLSQSELVTHFGLGDVDRAHLAVRWPSGARLRIEGLAPNRRLLVRK